MTARWEDVAPDFLAELAHVRRLSPLTVAAYRHDLRLLAAACPAGPCSVDPLMLRRELGRAHASGIAGRSLARRLSAWRTFYQWLVRSGRHDRNPATGLRPPRGARQLPGVLPPEAAARLVEGPAASQDNSLPTADRPANGRDLPERAHSGRRRAAAPRAGAAQPDMQQIQDNAMFELFYSSGLRLSELVRLDLIGLDLAAGLVTVLGKGSRTRTVPVGAAACAALRRWLALRSGLIDSPAQTALFIGRRGGRIAPRSVQERLARRGAALGLPQRVHPHMLRHSCASHVLQSSSDLRAVQELLGHASIASTQIYTHLDFQHLAQAYDAAHPRARKPPSGESS